MSPSQWYLHPNLRCSYKAFFSCCYLLLLLLLLLLRVLVTLLDYRALPLDCSPLLRAWLRLGRLAHPHIPPPFVYIPRALSHCLISTLPP
jgi:hypothetical protein